MYCSRILILIAIILCNTVHAQDVDNKLDYNKDTNHVFKTIFFKYNKRIRPYEPTNPSVSVNIDMTLVGITDIDKEKNELEAVYDITVYWRDIRLYWYSDIKYVTVNASTVWTPDVEFLNAVKAPQNVIDPRFVLIDYNGVVFWSRRFLLRTACLMNETANVHDCPVTIGSYQLPVQEQKFGDANCSLDDRFNNNNVEILDIYMTESERELKNHVFKNSTASEAHCLLFFKERIKPVKKRKPVKVVMDNGKSTLALNGGIFIISVIFILFNF